MRLIQGRKGGDAPVEQSDTLRAIQRAEIVDILGEGQIGGLVAGRKSIYIDGVPVENADGSLNFPEFGHAVTLGGPTGELPQAFDEVATEVGVGVEVTAAVPVVRTIADPTVNAVRVTIIVPTLAEQKSNGDRVGARIEWAVDVQSAGGGWVQRYLGVVDGKASSPYPRAVRIDLAATGPAPWDIRVRRITPDSTSANLVNAFSWASYTAITSVRMLYRHRAGVWLTFDAKGFRAIPQRQYDVMGISDWDIPANYDPLARTVSGVWDGTFTQGWTNNPAWVLYNLIQHRRYGLGEYLSELPDKWTLYQLQQWCDAPVPDGRGGTEPRYTCNAVINRQVEALRLLQDMAAVFRGVMLYGAGQLSATWDAPSAPEAIFTRANVEDGLFTYADGPRSQKKSSCTCWYNDLAQGGKRMPATWDDPGLVAKYGLRTMEIDPIGITSRGQALRMAKWALWTNELEDQTVSFKLGAQGATVRLGGVFQVNDPSETGERLGGRVRSATTTTVQLDAPVTLVSGESYLLWVSLPDPADATRLIAQSRPVTTGPGVQGTLTVSPAFTVAPVAQTMWLLEGDTVAPTLWRCVAIQEVRNGDAGLQFEVTGVRHEPGKWDVVELDQPLTVRPTRRLDFAPPKVASVDIDQTIYVDAEGKARIKVTVSWPAPAPGLRYVLSARQDNANWQTWPPTSMTSMDFDDVQPGFYEVQVQSMNVLRMLSLPTTAVAEITADDSLPPNMTGLTYALKLGQVWARWAAPAQLKWLQSVLRVGGTDWDSADDLWEGSGSDYKHPRPANGTYKLWGKHRNLAGRLSATAAYLEVTVDDTIDGVGATGAVRLTTSRLPYFEFADGTTHTTTSDDLGLQALLVGLFGTVAWAAEAYDATDTALGPVTLGGTGNARTMSGAQFVAPGMAGSVRYVEVTASLGGFADTLRVFRADPTVTQPRLFLSNPHHAVPTDESGEFGDYSGAQTDAAVVVGLADVTNVWTLSIEPDAGVDATVNGGPGPVSGAAAVSVAVSDMTIPTGAVLVRAAKSGETDLTATFMVDKNEATGTGYQAVWSPRTEIVLPVTAAGAVASYDDAWSQLQLIKGGQLNDTTNWALEATFRNVTGTLVDGLATVTAFLELGGIGSHVMVADLDTAPAGWAQIYQIYYAEGVWIATGIVTTAYSYIFRSTDFVHWTMVDVGAAGKWALVTHAQGAWVLARASDATTANLARRSTDGGLTWSPVTLSSPATQQAYGMAELDGHIVVFPQSGTVGSRSTDGGATWSPITLPGGGTNAMWSGAGLWLQLTNSGVVHISSNSGGSWTDDNANWPTDPIDAIAYKGRLVVVLWAATNKARYREPGGAWVTVTLPQTMNISRLVIVSDVLWMREISGSKVCFTTDGKTWRQGSTASANTLVRSRRSIPVDFLPAFDAPGGNLIYKSPLLATSDTDGAVIVDATKLGALPIRTVLPVRKGTASQDMYALSASPGFLLLPATSDGVVTSFASAVITLAALKNGAPDPSWTFSWVAPNMTPSSGTGSTITFTGMSSAHDTATITITCSSPGQVDRVEQMTVAKSKGTESSGPRILGAFAAVSTISTYVAIRLTTDGRVLIRRSPTGTWGPLLQWGGVIGPSNSAYWIKVVPDAGSHPLSSGTENTYLAMTSDRDLVLEDATSGTHVYSFDISIAEDNVGTNEAVGQGSLKLVVP